MVGFLGHKKKKSIQTKRQDISGPTGLWNKKMLNFCSCEFSFYFQPLRLGFVRLKNKNKWMSHWEKSSTASNKHTQSQVLHPSPKHLGIVELIGESRHVCHRAHVVPCGPTSQTAHIPDVLFRQLGRRIELHEAVHRGELAAGSRPAAAKKPGQIPERKGQWSSHERSNGMKSDEVPFDSWAKSAN